MQKTLLASALAITLGTAATAEAVTITITNMVFGPTYAAAGTMVDASTGVMSAVDCFFSHFWTATQKIWFDTHSNLISWSGGTSTGAYGAYSYTFHLTGNQVASGTFFDWNGNIGIPVLTIYDCATGGAAPFACTGKSLKMQTQPFPGQRPQFNGSTAAVIDARPVANDDAFSTDVGILKNFSLVANDTDFEDGSPPPVPPASIMLDLVGLAPGSTVVDKGDGSIDYTPGAGITNDLFEYKLIDSAGNLSDKATVIVTITGNNAPVANNVDFSTNEDVALMVNITDLDDGGGPIGTDLDADPLTFVNVAPTTPMGGSVTVSGANTILTYSPPANFNGMDPVTFSVTDGIDNSIIPAAMTITVAAQNDLPVCTDVALNTPINTPLAISETADLIATCTDADGDALSVTATSPPMPLMGIVTDDGAGTLTYTPPADTIGNDSFNYTVSDGNGGSDTKAVNIAVGVLLDNFTMLTGGGKVFGGTNDVEFVWDGVALNDPTKGMNNIPTDTTYDIMTIASKGPHPFFGAPWEAHHVRVYGPGTYTFDATCSSAQYDAGTTLCNGPLDQSGQTEQFISMTIGPNQVGAHMLFNWNGNNDIDVVNVWDVDKMWDTQGAVAPKNEIWTGDAGAAPHLLANWELVSTDHDGDGIVGSPMVDGPFRGSNANFSKGPDRAGTPPPDITTGTIDTILGAASLSWLSLLGALPILGWLRGRSKNKTGN